MRHPSLWLILNYPPQIKKEDQKTGSQYTYIGVEQFASPWLLSLRQLIISLLMYLSLFVLFFFFLYHHRTCLSLSFSFCFCLVDPMSRNTIARIRSDRISLLPMSPTPLSSVSLSSETLMGRMYGKTRFPFTRDNEKKKSSRPPPTWLGIVTGCCCLLPRETRWWLWRSMDIH